jgi:surface antigen
MELVMVDGCEAKSRAMKATIGWAIAFAMAASAPAGAQFPQSAYSYLAGGLTDQDMEIVKRSSKPLFEAAPPGAVAGWQNPDTGMSGSVLLRKIYDLKGMRCRQLQYTTQLRGNSYPSRRLLDWCETSSGEWKLVDPAELGHH